MKRLVFLFAFVLMLNSVIAINEEILDAKEATLSLDISSSFNIINTKNNYKIDYVTLRLSYFPIDSYRQKATDTIIMPEADDQQNYLVFLWESPRLDTYSFNLESKIKTKNDFFPIKTKVKYPLNNLPDEVIKYTKETDLIDFDDDIISLANEISKNKDDLYDIVFETAKWVNENIEYDLSTFTKDASLKSSWVLENRKGVCDELTNLFISILRSLGIPARFISGISYTNSEQFTEDFGPHGWAEVYFPEYGWVPFDPTYAEYGFLDAGHIKLKQSVDSDKSSVNYEWLSYGTKVTTDKLNTDVNIINMVEDDRKVLDYKINILEKKVGFGSYNVIEAIVKNLEDEYRPVEIDLIATKEIEKEFDTEYILLKPDEEKHFYFKIKFPENLDYDKIYTFPFTIKDNLRDEIKINITSAYNYQSLSEDAVDLYIDTFENKKENNNLDVDFICDNPKEINIEDELVISCTILDDFKDKNINACYGDDCQNINSKDFEFKNKFNESGVFPIKITLEELGMKNTYFSNLLVYDNPKISLEWSEYQRDVDYEDMLDIEVYLKQESVKDPQNIELFLNYNYLTNKLRLDDFEDSYVVKLNIKAKNLDIGENKIEIIAKYEDEKGNNYSQTFVNSVNMVTEDKLKLFLIKLNSFTNYLSLKIKEMFY